MGQPASILYYYRTIDLGTEPQVYTFVQYQDDLTHVVYNGDESNNIDTSIEDTLQAIGEETDHNFGL